MQSPRALTSYLPVTASLLQSRTGWSWCRLVRTRGGGREGRRRGATRTRGEKETQARKWRTCGWEEKQRSQKGERENVGFVKETRKTAKEIQSSLTFTVPGPPSQGCAKLWLMGCERAWESKYFECMKRFFFFFFLWISSACLQDTTYPSELAFQASHLKWCIRNVTSP